MESFQLVVTQIKDRYNLNVLGSLVKGLVSSSSNFLETYGFWYLFT